MTAVLAGKVAVVMGGTSGIGLATAQRLIKAGARVVVTGRDTARGALAQAGLGSMATYLPCDVSDVVSVTACFQALASRFGRLDCAVNAAALPFRLVQLPSTNYYPTCRMAPRSAYFIN